MDTQTTSKFFEIDPTRKLLGRRIFPALNVVRAAAVIFIRVNLAEGLRPQLLVLALRNLQRLPNHKHLDLVITMTGIVTVHMFQSELQKEWWFITHEAKKLSSIEQIRFLRLSGYGIGQTPFPPAWTQYLQQTETQLEEAARIKKA